MSGLSNKRNSFVSLVLAMMPFIVFGLIYGSFRFYPNYQFNDIDMAPIYNLEKELFGIGEWPARLTPNEWFAEHHCAIADVAAGAFYLLWVPLPVCFGLYLFFTNRHRECFRFASCFLFVNLIGFIGYYLHPAAPPWYVARYGFEPIFNTGGDVAGLGRFDELIGIPVFHSIYVNNSNVFAAVPSLHAAYCPVALYYAIRCRSRMWVGVLAVWSVGIWWTAVYSGHHYVVDVLLGILTCVVGVLLFEYFGRNVKFCRRCFEGYVKML
ncbi:MAG: inositol phosphorylceramide synthase [Bacteroidaceae bacterium]|nr:inositol phosphorylceramide synthase [Bacteroidaceae bacterium]